MKQMKANPENKAFKPPYISPLIPKREVSGKLIPSNNLSAILRLPHVMKGHAMKSTETMMSKPYIQFRFERFFFGEDS